MQRQISRRTIQAADKEDSGRSPRRRRPAAVNRRGASAGLEGAFWRELRAIAAEHGLTAAALIEDIAAAQKHRNLPPAIRRLVLRHRKRTRRKPSLPA